MANATAQLVSQVRDCANNMVKDSTLAEDLHENLIRAGGQCALASAQLVACARVVAPTIVSNPAGQEIVEQAAKEVFTFILLTFLDIFTLVYLYSNYLFLSIFFHSHSQ